MHELPLERPAQRLWRLELGLQALHTLAINGHHHLLEVGIADILPPRPKERGLLHTGLGIALRCAC